MSLAIGGMTCAACVRRVERALAKVEGVRDATVNLATERARVVFDPTVCARPALEAAVRGAGYTAEALAPERAPWAETAVALACGAAMMGAMFALPRALHGALGWASLAVTTVALPWVGRSSFLAAARALRHREANMHTLVSLGALAAYGVSAFVTVRPSVAHRWGLGHHVYFESALFVVGFVLLGRGLEYRARLLAGEAIRSLARMRPERARVIGADGAITELDLVKLRVGDRFVTGPGERVATDGEVIEGRARLDEAMMTGESAAVTRAAGDAVLGGTLVLDGALTVRATRVGSETALARIVAWVDQALSAKAGAQRFADAVASWFVPAVLVVAAGTFAGWWLIAGDLATAVRSSIAVLVIACPCALGLATPVAVMVGAGRAASLGIILRGPASLERATRIDTVVLDKTGTLTEGAPAVALVEVVEGMSAPELARIARAVEEPSTHPLARAVVRWANELMGQDSISPRVDGFAERAGAGVEGWLDGATVLAGRASWLRERGVDLTALDPALAAMEARGCTPVVFARDGRVVGALGLQDRIKPEAREAIAMLRALGARIVLLTGDRRAVADRVGSELGVDEVLAEARPEEKAARVASLRARGLRVAMVGDGVNDAPALAEADLGIALGSGADVARAASDLTLLGGDLRAVASAIVLARRTAATIRQGFVWAFAYNLVLIPVAAGALSRPLGVALDPALAAAAMSTSSVSVVLNALRLRSFRPLAGVDDAARAARGERGREVLGVLAAVGLAGAFAALSVWLAR